MRYFLEFFDLFQIENDMYLTKESKFKVIYSLNELNEGQFAY